MQEMEGKYIIRVFGPKNKEIDDRDGKGRMWRNVVQVIPTLAWKFRIDSNGSDWRNNRTDDIEGDQEFYSPISSTKKEDNEREMLLRHPSGSLKMRENK